MGSLVSPFLRRNQEKLSCSKNRFVRPSGLTSKGNFGFPPPIGRPYCQPLGAPWAPFPVREGTLKRTGSFLGCPMGAPHLPFRYGGSTGLPTVRCQGMSHALGNKKTDRQRSGFSVFTPRDARCEATSREALKLLDSTHPCCYCQSLDSLRSLGTDPDRVDGESKNPWFDQQSRDGLPTSRSEGFPVSVSLERR